MIHGLHNLPMHPLRPLQSHRCAISVVLKQDIIFFYLDIIPLCNHVVSKVTLVPCFYIRDTVGNGEVTINNHKKLANK